MSATNLERETIDHVATLASLSLTDREATTMTAEIGAILAYVEELGSVVTDDVPPTANVQLEAAAFRADDVEPGLAREDALAQAPRVSDFGFAVPGFIEG